MSQYVDSQKDQGREKAGHEIRPYFRPARRMEHGLLYDSSAHPCPTENPESFSATYVLPGQGDSERPADVSGGICHSLLFVPGERRYIQEWSPFADRK